MPGDSSIGLIIRSVRVIAYDPRAAKNVATGSRVTRVYRRPERRWTDRGRTEGIITDG